MSNLPRPPLGFRWVDTPFGPILEHDTPAKRGQATGRANDDDDTQAADWGRWMRQAVDRLKERGEWDDQETAGTGPPAAPERDSVDPPDSDSARHGNEVA